MQGQICGDGTDDHPFHCSEIRHYSVWGFPRFQLSPVQHTDAVVIDFRRQLVFFTYTMGLYSEAFVARVLAFVSLAMRALHLVPWTWDGWVCGNLKGPLDPTQNSCAVSVLLAAHRLSCNEVLPAEWSRDDLNTARDVISLCLRAQTSFAQRWDGCADADKRLQVAYEPWTLATHSRRVLEDALILAVHADSGSAASGSAKLDWHAFHGHAVTAFQQLVGTGKVAERLQAAEVRQHEMEVRAVAEVVLASGGVSGDAAAEDEDAQRAVEKKEAEKKEVAGALASLEQQLVDYNLQAKELVRKLYDAHEARVGAVRRPEG